MWDKSRDVRRDELECYCSTVRVAVRFLPCTFVLVSVAVQLYRLLPCPFALVSVAVQLYRFYLCVLPFLLYTCTSANPAPPSCPPPLPPIPSPNNSRRNSEFLLMFDKRIFSYSLTASSPSSIRTSTSSTLSLMMSWWTTEMNQKVSMKKYACQTLIKARVTKIIVTEFPTGSVMFPQKLSSPRFLSYSGSSPTGSKCASEDCIGVKSPSHKTL